MDTTETHIKMCDCEEVQAYKSVVFHYGMVLPYAGNDREIWLPRQDDIQKMMEITDVSDFELAVYDMFFEDNGFYHCSVTPAWRTENITTPEQLWLAFYMHEKHSKRWSGSEWVKAEKEIR